MFTFIKHGHKTCFSCISLFIFVIKIPLYNELGSFCSSFSFLEQHINVSFRRPAFVSINLPFALHFVISILIFIISFLLSLGLFCSPSPNFWVECLAHFIYVVFFVSWKVYLKVKNFPLSSALVISNKFWYVGFNFWSVLIFLYILYNSDFNSNVIYEKLKLLILQ